MYSGKIAVPPGGGGIRKIIIMTKILFSFFVSSVCECVLKRVKGSILRATQYFTYFFVSILCFLVCFLEKDAFWYYLSIKILCLN
jgi:hypothetical protein